MEIYKICNELYASKITSSGAENRWNLKGQLVSYFASTRSLATVELVAHRSSIEPKKNYKVMVVSIEDDDSLIKQIKIKDLPTDWNKLSAYPELQKIGSEWYETEESLILKVPSVIITQEYNFVINTKHPLFPTKVKFIRQEDYFWDSRLL